MFVVYLHIFITELREAFLNLSVIHAHLLQEPFIDDFLYSHHLFSL